MNWLARQPPTRVAALAVGWALGLPALGALYLAALLWPARQRAIAVQVHADWTLAAVLGLPPAALLLVWAVARRRADAARDAAPSR